MCLWCRLSIGDREWVDVDYDPAPGVHRHERIHTTCLDTFKTLLAICGALPPRP